MRKENSQTKNVMYSICLMEPSSLVTCPTGVSTQGDGLLIWFRKCSSAWRRFRSFIWCVWLQYEAATGQEKAGNIRKDKWLAILWKRKVSERELLRETKIAGNTSDFPDVSYCINYYCYRLKVNVARMTLKMRRAEIEERMDSGMSYEAAGSQPTELHIHNEIV